MGDKNRKKSDKNQIKSAKIIKIGKIGFDLNSDSTALVWTLRVTSQIPDIGVMAMIKMMMKVLVMVVIMVEMMRIV